MVCVGGGGLQKTVVQDRLAAPTVEHECGGSGAFTPASVSITQLKSTLDPSDPSPLPPKPRGALLSGRVWSNRKPGGEMHARQSQ